MARKGCWSYNAGERGKNWVRAYEDGQGGVILLEWLEPVVGQDGIPVLDPRTNRPQMRRKRRSLGHRDQKKARKQADEQAERFAELDPSAPTRTIRLLLHRYLREVTPRKGESKRKHDARAVRVFLAFFDGQGEKGRRSDRHPSTLDKRDWDGFIEARRTGRIGGFDPVRSEQTRKDLKFMLAVLAWASGAEEDAPHHLAKNPWRYERRKAQGMELPKEKKPRRPAMGEREHAELLEHSPDWRFTLVMELTRETLHRVNSVRLLQWTDIDLAGGLVRWREDFDKNRIGAVTPLSESALEALRSAPRVMGSPWVLPAPEDPARPVSRSTLNKWMERAKRRAGAMVEGLGFHGQKRAGVRREEFRTLAPKVQEVLTGTTWETLRNIYDDVTMREMQDAVRRLDRGERRAA